MFQVGVDVGGVGRPVCTAAALGAPPQGSVQSRGHHTAFTSLPILLPPCLIAPSHSRNGLAGDQLIEGEGFQSWFSERAPEGSAKASGRNRLWSVEWRTEDAPPGQRGFPDSAPSCYELGGRRGCGHHLMRLRSPVLRRRDGGYVFEACMRVHVGIDKANGEGQAGLVSLNKFGGRVASHAQGSFLWFLPPSVVPIRLTHIAQVLTLDPGQS